MNNTHTHTHTHIINQLPPCRSKPVKALFVFRTQILYILDENREACDCPTDSQVNNTVKAQKSMKYIIKICHQWFNLTVMKRREYFARKENTKYFIQQCIFESA